MVNGIVIFDPLDREIVNSNDPDNNQAICRDDLLDILTNELQGLDGQILRAPLSDTNFDSLIKMMKNYEQACRQKLKKMVDSAKVSEVAPKISDQSEVQLMLRGYELFTQFQIISSEKIVDMSSKFHTYLEEQQMLVDEIVQYKLMEIEIERSLLDVK